MDWAGALPGARIMELLREAHFFVFPTRHIGEGQSNALTEAMACGCVPIASRHGFNEAVIGDAALTLPVDAIAATYADVVESIWPTRWAELSQRMQRRVRERFSTTAAVRTLLGVYRRTADIAR
jgi:glycosyltransferase involved in cell wall biosynthesis